MMNTTGVDPVRFREVMGSFASGVTIITASTSSGPVGFTCQSFTSLSLDPPMVAVAPSKRSTSWPKIAAAGSFCVNVLAEGQEVLCRRFAVSAAERKDKFDGVDWVPAPSGAPVLDGVLSWVDCALVAAHDAGDHELVLGRVLDLHVVVDGGSPLVFYRGQFARLDRADMVAGSGAVVAEAGLDQGDG